MIIVTGTSGFLGGALSESLGPVAIRISRSNARIPDHHRLELTIREHVEKFTRSQTRKPISHLIHCAGVTPQSAASDYRADLAMAENVASVCETLEIGTLVLLSGWVVYDPQATPPVSETAALTPGTPYGRSKLAVENALRDQLGHTRVITLRLASIYGPGQRSAGLIPNLVASARDAGTVTIRSLKTRRDYLYIDDFVAAVHSALKLEPSSHLELNLGSGRSVTVEEVSAIVRELFAQHYARDVRVRVSKPAREATPIDNELAIVEAKRLGLITSTTKFATGLLEYIKWAGRENLP